MIHFDTSKLVKEIANKFTYIIDRKISALNELREDNILTEKEVSTKLKVSQKTISNMRKKGTIPQVTYFYVGKSVRYRESKVIEYFVSKDKLI
jgi:predicted DNA-binding transcriptional regulator AlpA